MSFDEEHLDEHYECQREVAERDARIHELEAALRLYWDARDWGEVGAADAVAKKLLTPAETKAQQGEWVFDNGQYIGSCDPNKFINISPAGMTYCPYCGRPVITLKTEVSDER